MVRPMTRQFETFTQRIDFPVVDDRTPLHVLICLLYRLDFCRRLRLVVPGCGHQRRIQGIASTP